MIPVKVVNVSISNVGFMVLLSGAQDEQTLPIFIGVSEAQAIAMELNETVNPRPMTHDLMRNLLEHLGHKLIRVIINSLNEGTFYARLVVEGQGEEVNVDARPSDAIALALRCTAPIFVDEDVMKEAGVVVEEEADETEVEEQERDEGGEEEFASGAGKKQQGVGGAVSGDKLGQMKKKLQQAVNDERYEEAAKLRDQIEQYMSHN